MSTQLPIHRPVSIVRIAIVALFALALVAANRLPARAADLAEQAHSLRKVPADAAFYSSSLRLKEQWDTFIESKAYAKLMEIPLVQLGKMQVGFQWQQSNEPPIAKFREYIQSPAGQDAVAVLKRDVLRRSLRLRRQQHRRVDQAVHGNQFRAYARRRMRSHGQPAKTPKQAVAEKVLESVQRQAFERPVRAHVCDGLSHQRRRAGQARARRGPFAAAQFLG